MNHLEFWLWILALAGLVLGGWSVCSARGEGTRARWARRIFVATLLGLGISGLVAAIARADGTVTVGLLAGFLLIAMLWETPILVPAKED